MSTVSNAIQNLGLINGLLSTSINQPVPVVGMGATSFCGSDRSAHTIVEVSANGKRIGLVSAKTKLTSDYYSQDYEITPGTLEEGQTPWYFTKRKDGKFRPEGSSMKERAIMVGDAQQYRDPSF